VCIGELAHGQGWLAVLLLLAGVAWSIVLLIPGWLAAPLAAERGAVAAVYDALASLLQAAGLPRFPQAHQAVVTALSAAWDVASGRVSRAGRDPDLVRLAALLSQTHALTEAAVTLVQEGARPPPEVIAEIEAIARAVRGDGPPPGPLPSAGDTTGATAMTKALAGAVDLLAGKRRPDGADALHRPPLQERVRDALDQTVGGRLTRVFALRVMISMGVAAVVSQASPLQRSYWVVLTVAIVLRPDFGSVFARALQRGLGTVVGAVAGAVIIALVPYGPWLLLPVAVLAGLLPYGQVRRWGLFSTFLTPLVVILHRPAGEGRLAARPGPAHRHPARLRCGPAGRLRPVAVQLACPPPAQLAAVLDSVARSRSRPCSASPAGHRSGGRPTGPCPTFARSCSARWPNPAPPAGPPPGCGPRC